jgi:hypothetical protein
MKPFGKTWFAWKMVISISKGEDFGPWECGRPWKTLYVDGEMPLQSMQDRLLLLDQDSSEDLYLMSHDDLTEVEIIFNLCKEYQQEWLFKVLHWERDKGDLPGQPLLPVLRHERERGELLGTGARVAAAVPAGGDRGGDNSPRQPG